MENFLSNMCLQKNMSQGTFQACEMDISISLKPETIKVLALGLIFCTCMEPIYSMSDRIDGNSQQSQTTHKEGCTHMKSGAQDREGIRMKLQKVLPPGQFC